VGIVVRHNIVKLDSKGRILIPYHIRELLDMDSGSEFIIMSNYNGEVKLLPMVKGKTAEIRILMEDKPGNLTQLTQLLGKANVDIVMSQLKVIERGHLAEWHAIADVSECPNPKRLSTDIAKVSVVKKVTVEQM